MKLGKLKRLDVRTVWPNEASDFTNWLAQEDNLILLSDKVGIEIKLVKTEASVGAFSVDILAEEENTGKRIIIENQLEPTDHDHLGKLLTYAAGHDATYVLWVVAEVREEHKKAIDWLNERTDDELSFFLVKVDILQIDESPLAPDFDVISKPNDWAKAIRDTAKGELSDTKLLQLEYWDKFKIYAETKATRLRLRKTHPQHWYDISFGTSLCHIALMVNTVDSLIECDIWIGDSKDTFKKFYEKKDTIENELGSKLEWLEMSGKKTSRIRIYNEIDVKDLTKWEQCFEWMLDKAEKFALVFKKHL